VTEQQHTGPKLSRERERERERERTPDPPSLALSPSSFLLCPVFLRLRPLLLGLPSQWRIKSAIHSVSSG